MLEFLQYTHHGNLVWVRKDLKGTHRDVCLCYSCEKFVPEEADNNCAIARENYLLCVKYSLVLPVFECPEFLALESEVE